ncbi:hypothetical protein ABT56_04530 [Photobacterium aquae]|uniref:Thiamine biosynthesis protein ThiS n=1 Tax=Photobacterium aquae TaxID=1195763 RepID=A0A0J1JZ76_9GAMM|nr:hypothetical protein ABT56_04530 [Photobacterium aquae]
MQIVVNDKPLTVAGGTHLAGLLALLEMPLAATAVALNEDIVARGNWEDTVLNDGDRIALFQAIAGG